MVPRVEVSKASWLQFAIKPIDEHENIPSLGQFPPSEPVRDD